MTEPRMKLDDALQHVAPAWDDARTERTLQGAHRRRARRTRVMIAGASLSVLIAVAGALQFQAAPLARAPLANERTLGFSDGSRAILLDATADVVVERVSDAAIDVRLAKGSARFEVAPQKGRAFRVTCGEVVVRVIGTAFELQREGARTRVHVLHGRVGVRWPGGSTQLGAGADRWFGREEQAAKPSTPGAPSTPSTSSTPEPSIEVEKAAPKRPRTQSWRQHAEQGDFQEAYALLEPERVSDDVEELLLAADAARLSGHAAQAVPYLQRVVDKHTVDPRAPLAAFTLGGVLMNQLGRPREAEAAYARARAMSPSSALSQDALARQVEAAHRASDAARARTLALEYLDRYPEGRRVQAVRRFGGLP